jgi:flagellar protein FlbD
MEGEWVFMIHLTRINHLPLILNSDLIEHIEATPDTVVSLTTGQKMIVLESPSEIIDRVVHFRQRVQIPSQAGNRVHWLETQQPGYTDDDLESWNGIC